MSTPDAVAGVLWVGVTLYAVFGGADFGAGFWALFTGRDERGERARSLIDWAIGPVWEANHVWLIFVLVVLWTAFSGAFAAIFSTLFIPLTLAALGIVFRGSGFAFHNVAPGFREREVSRVLFGVSSILTPFFMGTVIGAIASGRVPLGNADGDPFTSWFNVVSLVTGLLFVATSAYLAAVFLVHDSRRAEDPEMESYFAKRAQFAAAATGALAVIGIFVFRNDARYVYDGLVGEALPLVILSIIFGIAVMVALVRGKRTGIRVGAVGAVVTMIWAWGWAQYPYLLPTSQKISEGAANDSSLVSVLVIFGAAVLLVIPSLGLLYVLTQKSVLEEEH